MKIAPHEEIADVIQRLYHYNGNFWQEGINLNLKLIGLSGRLTSLSLMAGAALDYSGLVPSIIEDMQQYFHFPIYTELGDLSYFLGFEGLFFLLYGSSCGVSLLSTIIENNISRK